MEEKITKELLVDLKREQHLSNKEISEKLNVDWRKINKIINNFKITYKEKDKDFLTELYNKNLSFVEMGKICKCKGDTVKSNLIKFGIITDNRKSHICHECNVEFRCGGGKYEGNKYCGKHYKQLKKHKKILKRTIRDNNEFIVEDDIVNILLYDMKGNLKDRAIIDKDDLSLCNKYKWYLSKHGYVETMGVKIKKDNPNFKVRIHSLITDTLNESVTIDHINNNPLDNRKCNLRVVTNKQNSINRSISTINKSGVTGICRNNKDTKWKVYINNHENKQISLGHYKSFDEAVIVRLKGEVEYFGCYSNNFNPSNNKIELTYTSKDDNKEKFISLPL